MAVAREKLRLVRAKKRATRKAKDSAYYEFIKKRDAEMELEDDVQVDVDLVQPDTVTEHVKEKITISTKPPTKSKKLKLRKSLGGDGAPSALMPSEGRSMGMEVE